MNEDLIQADKHDDDRSSPGTTLLVVLLAAAATFVLSVMPFAGIVTWPLRLFTTFIHEGGHALAALLSFGDVHSIVVKPNGSGVTMTSGGWRFLISSAGYLGTTLFGVWMLLSARKTSSAKTALAITGVVIVLLTSLYAGRFGTLPVLGGAALGMGLLAAAALSKIHVVGRFALAGFGMFALIATGTYLFFGGALLTWVLGLGSGAMLMAAAWYTGGDVTKLIAAFLGVQVSLDAVGDVVGLMGLSAFSSVHTDAVNMANHYALPPLVWAALWSAISVLMVVGAVGFLFWDAKRA